MSNIEQGGGKAYNTNTGGTLIVSSKTALTGSTPTSGVVTNSSSIIVNSNSSRKGLIIQNLSNNNISLAFGSSNAVVNTGITLTPNGLYQMTEYDYSTQAINAISTGVSSIISIQEFI